jgi:hypothetical protein
MPEVYLACHKFFFSGYVWIVYTSLKGMLD